MTRMASSVSTALAIRLRQARKQLIKDQQQQQHPQSQTSKQHLKPPVHHHYQQHLQHQHQRRPSNQPAARKSSKTLPGASPAFDSPHRSHHSAWEGCSDPSGSIGASQLGLGPEAFGDKTALDHRLRSDKAHKTWVRKHRIADTLAYVGYEERSKRGAVIDMLMWLGLGILGVGTVVSFVGLGEKGFRSSELRLLGPILSGFGLALCIIRVCLCCSGCDPRRRPPPSKLVAEFKKMEAGREPIQMVRIAEAIAFMPAMHQAGETRTSQYALPQIQHHTPVEVDPGVYVSTHEAEESAKCHSSSVHSTSRPTLAHVGRQQSQESIGSDNSSSQQIITDAVIHPQVMDHTGPHEGSSLVSLPAAKSASPTHLILDPGRLGNNSLRLPLILSDQGPSSSEPTSPSDSKHTARSYLSDSPYSIS